MKKSIALLVLSWLSLANASEFYSESLKDYQVLGKASWSPQKIKRTYRQYALKKMIQEGPRTLAFEYVFYKAKRKRQENLLVLLPTISGVTALEHTLARYFVKKGLDVVIPVSLVRDFKFGPETVKAMDEGFWRSIIQTKSILDDLRKLNTYKETFVMGGSQGGTRAAMLLGQNLNINKAYTFVGGGDFPTIFAESDVKQVKKLRDAHKKALGFKSNARYKIYLERELKFDPSEFCGLRKADMRMVVALKDTSVPTSTQQSLWEGCGRPPKKEIKTGHVRGVLSMWWYRKDVFSYFTQE